MIFSTHLHDLAADIGKLNAGTPGDSVVASLVAMVSEDGAGGEARRTYRIVPAPPIGQSYARDITRRYGISFEQLQQKLAERGASAHAPLAPGSSLYNSAVETRCEETNDDRHAIDRIECASCPE